MCICLHVYVYIFYPAFFPSNSIGYLSILCQLLYWCQLGRAGNNTNGNCNKIIINNRVIL